MAFVPAVFETIRTLAHGSISGSYAFVGAAYAHPIQKVLITNNTNGDLIFSTDGSTDMIFVAQASYQLYDLTTDGGLALPIGTRFSVKQVTAPSAGSVYITAIYGKGE